MRADDIPIAHTPEGGWRGDMPPPVLAGCDEPLPPGAPDLRGLWQAYHVERDGAVLDDHPLVNSIQRIEQCGDRVVITASARSRAGIIHDMRADGALEHGVDDVAEMDLKTRIRVAAVFTDGRLDLHPNGVDPARPALVTRQLDGDELLWHYAVFTVRCRRVESPPR